MYPDYNETFTLDCDASAVAVGAVLSQRSEGKERVVAYYSKMLSREEMNYCATRREMLAIVKAVKHFRVYLYGTEFKVRTDHASLIWLLKSSVPQGQVARWISQLSEYRYTPEHRSGDQHGNADGLSRTLCKECCDQCERHFKAADPREHGNVPTIQRDSSVQCDLGSSEENHAVQLCVLQAKQRSELAMEQREDPDIGPIYTMLQRRRPIAELDCKEKSWETTKLARMGEHLSLRADGVMMARLPIGNRRRDLVVCPRVRRQEVISQAHRQAHLGISKTTARIRLNWIWPGLTAEVKRAVNLCETCQQSKSAYIKQPKTDHHLNAGRVLQDFAIDLAGPYPVTARGNTMILVMADHFSRWVDGIAIPDGKAETIARVLDERVFCYMGVPETIHSDMGPQMESQLLAECCRLWGCEKTRCTPYHPTSNSKVERLNRTVGASLRALLLDLDQREWDAYLPQIFRTLRSVPHSTTAETANYLVYGREVRIPGDLLMEQDGDHGQPVNTYAADLQSRLREVHDLLRNQQHAVRVVEHDEPPLYSVGDSVWLKSYKKKKGLNPKLDRKYTGPYCVKAVLPFHTYALENNGKTSVQHEARIRLHLEADESQTPPEITSNAEPLTGPTSPSPPAEPESRLENLQRHKQTWGTHKDGEQAHIRRKRTHQRSYSTVEVTPRFGGPLPAVPTPSVPVGPATDEETHQATTSHEENSPEDQDDDLVTSVHPLVTLADHPTLSGDRDQQQTMKTEPTVPEPSAVPRSSPTTDRNATTTIPIVTRSGRVSKPPQHLSAYAT